MPYFSPSTGGFYDDDIHGKDIPSDAVKISKRKHQLLLEAQASGAAIIAGPKGPVADMPLQSHEDQLANAQRRVKREARRRILKIASLETQSNDNAAIACAALQAATETAMTIDVGPALKRRQMIDAVRAASDVLEFELEQLPTAELLSFHPAQSAGWPTFEGAD